MTTSNDVILKRIESMEAELKNLKKLLKPVSAGRKAKPRQASHAPRVEEEDFQEARRSLFKHADDPDI
jgi:hypothetical protein